MNDRFRVPLGQILVFTFFLLSLGAATSICAAEESMPLVITGPGTDDSGTPRVEIPSVLILQLISGPISSETFTRTLNPVHPLDKGSILTDLSLGLGSAPPNAIEMGKLDSARRAVDASRAAGTLIVEPPSTPVAPETPKIDAMREAEALPLVPDPAACVGDTPPSLQIPGPVDLTPGEIAKRASRPETEAPRSGSGKEEK